ncbi:MAG: hypothetical protein PUP93_16210 [Rhizonema sp. NSF051]|nr:hypothetical protein [Rhizonema sp. NSF051]
MQARSVKTNPLTDADKTLIAEIVRRSDYTKPVAEDDVITIFLVEEVNMVVVRLTTGWARFHRDKFKRVLEEVKAETQPTPPTPRERNEKLNKELVAVASSANVAVTVSDWVSFSAIIFGRGLKLGTIGCNVMGRYWVSINGRKQSQTVENFADAIAVLTQSAMVFAA